MALELEPYLHFGGNCEEALNFYKGVFGGEITSINRFEGSPMESELPPDYKNKIMHANFKSPSLKFMGSDGMPGGNLEKGSRVTLSLGGNDVNEGERIFNALAAEGTVSMPYQDMFWGAKFGMLTDKYGIDWMINIEKP
jgi:PhnB protein